MRFKRPSSQLQKWRLDQRHSHDNLVFTKVSVAGYRVDGSPVVSVIAGRGRKSVVMVLTERAARELVNNIMHLGILPKF